MYYRTQKHWFVRNSYHQKTWRKGGYLLCMHWLHWQRSAQPCTQVLCALRFEDSNILVETGTSDLLPISILLGTDSYPWDSRGFAAGEYDIGGVRNQPRADKALAVEMKVHIQQRECKETQRWLITHIISSWDWEARLGRYRQPNRPDFHSDEEIVEMIRSRTKLRSYSILRRTQFS